MKRYDYESKPIEIYQVLFGILVLTVIYIVIDNIATAEYYKQLEARNDYLEKQLKLSELCNADYETVKQLELVMNKMEG